MDVAASSPLVARVRWKREGLNAVATARYLRFVKICGCYPCYEVAPLNWRCPAWTCPNARVLVMERTVEVMVENEEED